MENRNDDIDAKRLIERAQKGDRSAFDALYAQFLTPVYRYIYLRVQERGLCEDLTQTVFLKIYQSLPRYADRHKPLLAYFFTVARNTVIDYFRKERGRAAADLSEVEQRPDQRIDFARDLDNRLAKDLIERHLKLLSEEQQSAIILKYLSGFSNGEIAEILGKSEAAVRQLQCRGLKILRERLRKTQYGK